MKSGEKPGDYSTGRGTETLLDRRNRQSVTIQIVPTLPFVPRIRGPMKSVSTPRHDPSPRSKAATNPGSQRPGQVHHHQPFALPPNHVGSRILSNRYGYEANL